MSELTRQSHRDQPVAVELLGGAVCDVFVDTAGIVVLPRHDGHG
jgi:hypothetical protein